MVYLPNHAFLGNVLPFRKNEQNIDINGFDYLSMEPKGPAKFPLGHIAARSSTDIANNLYSLQEIP